MFKYVFWFLLFFNGGFLTGGATAPLAAPLATAMGHLSQLKPTLAKLVCYCYAVTTRSYSDNTELFLASWLDLAASFGQPSFVTWLELARVGSTVWPKALNNQFLSVSHNYRHDAIRRPNRNFHQIKPTKVEGPGVLTV